MISNVSRITTFLECRQKDAYLWEQRLLPNRTPTPLLTGGAFAKGQEVFFKTEDVSQAVLAVEQNYQERLGEMAFVLPEEQLIYEKETKFAKMAMQFWAKKYKEFGFQVLYPEVTFLVPFGGTEHHCYWMHKLLYPDIPFDQCPTLNGFNYWEPGDRPPNRRGCWIQHHIKGRCDGVVQKQGKIWLLETKTGTVTGPIWYDQWPMDLQLTSYAWGVSKQLGIRINGIVLNIVKKPHPNFRGSIEEHFAHEPFEQEAYIRTDEDLEAFEREAKLMWDDRERAHSEGRIYKSPRRATCVAFNRRCYFYDLCLRHGEQLEGEFLQRPLDYVEEDYYKLAGLEPPEKPKATPAVLYEEASNG